MCPFAVTQDLNELREQLIALWYEEQRLRRLAEQAEQREQGLREQAEQAEQRERTLREQNEALAQKLQRLEAQLAGAKRKTNKNRSERRPRTGHNNDRDKGAGNASREPQKGHGPTEQPHLEQQTRVFDLDEADKVCTACGRALDPWEGHDDSSVLIEVIERRFICKTITQKKYRCRCGTASRPRWAPSG